MTALYLLSTAVLTSSLKAHAFFDGKSLCLNPAQEKVRLRSGLRHLVCASVLGGIALIASAPSATPICSGIRPAALNALFARQGECLILTFGERYDLFDNSSHIAQYPISFVKDL
jgi:hypothetical protein